MSHNNPDIRTVQESELPIVLKSETDPTVNTILGRFETRFITRADGDEAIIYLSSAEGCAQACRMCWLTQTGQTNDNPATLEDFVNQAKHSLAEAEKYHSGIGKPPLKVHYNFMARGEPLLNPVIRERWHVLSEALLVMAREFLGQDIEIKFKISTIMTGIYEYNDYGTPVGGWTELPFEINKPEIYYSLYSMDPVFRKRWLPKAEDPEDMMRMLATYKRQGGRVRIHGSFIQGHNDEMRDVQTLYNSIKFFGLHEKFNIVRFNSPDPTKWQEATEEDLDGIKKFLESRGVVVQMIPRVGPDVSASCGTFINVE